MKYLLLTVISFFLSSCSTVNSTSYDNTSLNINTQNFYRVQDADFENFYKQKIVGKLVLWTDSNFLSTSNLGSTKLKSSKKVFLSNMLIGELQENSKITIYITSGSKIIYSNIKTDIEKFKNVEIIGGTETQLYWKNPEAPMSLKSVQDVNFSASEIISYNTSEQLKTLYPFKISIEDLSTTDNQAILRIEFNHPLAKLFLNSNPVNFTNEDFVIVKKPIVFGENIFEFIANDLEGNIASTKYLIYRETEVEKKRKLTQLQAEAKRQDLLLEQAKVKIANEQRAERIRIAEEEKQNQIKAANEAKAKKAELERIAREGDGSNEDKLCQRYGLKPQTNGYAECRMRLDFAKAESIKQQQQYEREQAAYQEQMAAIQKERERQRAMKQLELGLRMMGGQSPVDAVNSVGTGAPIAPRAPTPTNQTITLPNGRMVNCTTMGTMTNCF